MPVFPLVAAALPEAGEAEALAPVFLAPAVLAAGLVVGALPAVLDLAPLPLAAAAFFAASFLSIAATLEATLPFGAPVLTGGFYLALELAVDFM